VVVASHVPAAGAEVDLDRIYEGLIDHGVAQRP
jgi:hypothetical protein